MMDSREHRAEQDDGGRRIENRGDAGCHLPTQEDHRGKAERCDGEQAMHETHGRGTVSPSGRPSQARDFIPRFLCSQRPSSAPFRRSRPVTPKRWPATLRIWISSEPSVMR
jgi:hypothetical protein